VRRVLLVARPTGESVARAGSSSEPARREPFQPRSTRDCWSSIRGAAVPSVWEAEGRAEVTARWCLVVPALSTDPASDLTGRATDYQRVQGILTRHRRELQRLVPTGAGTGRTRLSCWSSASRDERPDLTRDVGFRLSVGIPSGLSPLPVPEIPPQVGQPSTTRSASPCRTSQISPEERCIWRASPWWWASAGRGRSCL
jgi:hypothetical protein